MPSSTVENYLRHIYLALIDNPSMRLSMGQLASLMEVVPGTATAMVKTLAEAGLVDYEPYAGVSLTKQGEVLAIHMVRRHRLLELFLVEVLALDWNQVHEEADKLEHAVSDRIIERIDQMLGYPELDPHGDPIPKPDGQLGSPPGTDLTQYAAGATVTLVRVADQDPAFLTFLRENNLSPQSQLTVIERDSGAGTFRLRVGGQVVTLSREVASKLLVATG